MVKLHSSLFISCCIAISVMADVAVSLKGTVKNGEGTAIAGAVVSLASKSSVHDTTNGNGEFTISTTTATRPSGMPVPTVRTISIKGNQLRFFTTAPINAGTIALFSSDGKICAAIPLVKSESGIHTQMLPQITPGCYVLSITIGQTTSICKLVNTGSEMFLSSNASGVTNAPRISGDVAAETVDSLNVQKEGFKPLTEPVTSYNQTGIAIIMDRTKSPTISVKDLPEIKEMPDPLTMLDGTKVSTPEQWKARRREMIRILEDYEYGHMPPPPGNVKATVATATSRVTASGKQADYRMMHLTFGPGEKCGFDLGIFTPVTPPEGKGYPILIYLGYSSPTKSSLGDASAALSRGYAVAIINYTQLGADASNYKTTGFFPSYPDYDWRDFSAWAWGLSRAVDYLVTDSSIDKEKIMATGVSRCGQPVLLAGAFDERIALSAPVAGGMALRFSGKEMGGGKGQGITEVVDQGTNWFGPLFEKFKNQTPRLPCDQHWLPALTAPRLFIMCNSFADEYGRAYAAVQTYLGAKPVYAFLKADDNLGLNFRAGSHGMTSEDWSALLDFADQKLLKKAGTRKFDVIPPADKTP